MLLEQFSRLVASCPEALVRNAVAATLAKEVPRTPEGFQRFYDDVIDELRLMGGEPASGTYGRHAAVTMSQS